MVTAKQLDQSDDSVLAPLVWVTQEESRRQFDQLAREWVGMSGDEFIRKLKAGDFLDIPDDEEHRAYAELAIMSGVER